jgi:hypothetical protein
MKQILAGGAALAASAPLAALACPVCFSNGNPRVLEAYYFTAAMMTVLPLALLGGVAAWIYRRAKRARQLTPPVTA